MAAAGLTLAREMEAERGGRGRGRGGRGRGARGKGSADQVRRPSGAPRGLEELVYPEYLSAEAAAAGLAVRQRSSKRPQSRGAAQYRRELFVLVWCARCSLLFVPRRGDS